MYLDFLFTWSFQMSMPSKSIRHAPARLDAFFSSLCTNVRWDFRYTKDYLNLKPIWDMKTACKLWFFFFFDIWRIDHWNLSGTTSHTPCITWCYHFFVSCINSHIIYITLLATRLVGRYIIQEMGDNSQVILI